MAEERKGPLAARQVRRGDPNGFYQSRVAENIENTFSLDALKSSALFIAEFTPIIGDAFAAQEIYKEIKKDDTNWPLVGALGGAAIIGLVPGVGDLAAKGIRLGAKKGLRNKHGDLISADEYFKMSETGGLKNVSKDDYKRLQSEIENLERTTQNPSIRVAEISKEGPYQKPIATTKRDEAKSGYNNVVDHINIPIIKDDESFLAAAHEVSHASSPLGSQLDPKKRSLLGTWWNRKNPLKRPEYPGESQLATEYAAERGVYTKYPEAYVRSADNKNIDTYMKGLRRAKKNNILRRNKQKTIWAETPTASGKSIEARQKFSKTNPNARNFYDSIIDERNYNNPYDFRTEAEKRLLSKSNYQPGPLSSKPNRRR